MNKILQVLTVFTGITLAGLGGVMAMTNPGQVDYELYATDQLSGYLKENVCTQAPQEFEGLVRSGCKTLVDTGRPQIKHIISQTTKRQNFVLFSVYQTELSFSSSVIPSYQFETIGLLQNFYTYGMGQF